MNGVRIATGRRLTSWLYTKRGGVEFETCGRKEDLNPGPPDYKPTPLTVPLGPRLPRVQKNEIGWSLPMTTRVPSLPHRPLATHAPFVATDPWRTPTIELCGCTEACPSPILLETTSKQHTVKHVLLNGPLLSAVTLC